MNKFRNFCVALSLLVAYTSSACWYPTYEPQYYLTYNAEYEVENGSQTSNMIKMWQKLIPGASEQDVKSLIYSDGYGIDEIRYLKVPYHLQSRLSRNNNELRDYIILMRQTAKECDKTTDPWYFYYDNDPRLQILDSLADVAMSRLDGQLGDRYAIQAARALRATRKFDDIIALFNRHQFNDYELKSIFEESLASAYYHTGRYDDALKIYRRKDDERSLQWTLEKLGKATNIYDAPVAVIVCADKTKAWKRPFDGMQTTDIDASILTDHMMLEAVEQGLGTVWICYFKPDVLKEEFKLPDSLEPINILAIGYADASVVKPAKDRIPVKELVEYL